MIGNDEGLTKTYNRFHDPEERSPDILRLLALKAGRHAEEVRLCIAPGMKAKTTAPTNQSAPTKIQRKKRDDELL